MKKLLVTGGTTFVSKYAAQYFIEHGYDVYAHVLAPIETVAMMSRVK